MIPSNEMTEKSKWRTSDIHNPTRSIESFLKCKISNISPAAFSEVLSVTHEQVLGPSLQGEQIKEDRRKSSQADGHKDLPRSLGIVERASIVSKNLPNTASYRDVGTELPLRLQGPEELNCEASWMTWSVGPSHFE
jgi:hypothetical protein